MAMDLGTAIAYIDLDLTAFNQGIESVNSAMQSLKTGIEDGDLSFTNFLDSAGSLATNIGGGFTKTLTAPILGFGESAIKAGMDFDEGMSKVLAITGATDKEFQDLRQLAIDMGASTKFSATEATEAMVYMGMAGWDAQDIIKGLAGVMNLAAASGEDLGTVSDIVTDSLTAFGKDADYAADYADLLAQAARRSNTNVALMGETFKYVAPVAGTFGMSTNDVAFAVGLMANNGIKASQAGTSLRSALTRLAAPTDDATSLMVQLGLATEETAMVLDEGAIQKAQDKVTQQTLKMEAAQLKYNNAVSEYGEGSYQAESAMISLQQAQYNLEVAVRDLDAAQQGSLETMSVHNDLMTNEDGTSRELFDVITDLRGAFQNLSEEEQIQAANTLFGKTAMAGMLAIINSSDKDFEELSEALRDTSSETNGLNGAAEDMADTMLDNLAGSLTLLNSALESLKIKMNDVVSGALKDFIDKVIKLIEWFVSLDDETIANIIQWGLILAAIGPVLMIVGKLMTGFSNLIKMFKLIKDTGAIAIGFFQGLKGTVDLTGEAVTKSGGIIKTFVEVIKTAGTMLFNGAKTLVGWIGKIGAAFIQHIGPIIKVAGGVTALVGGIITAVQGFFDILKDGFSWASEAKMAIGLALAAFGAWLLGVPGLLAAAIAGAVFLIGNFIALIVRNWDSIKEGFSNAMEFIKDWFSHLGVSLSAFAQEMWARLTEFLGGIWDAVKQVFSDIFGEIGHFAQNMVRGAAEFFDTLFNGAHGFLGNLFSAVMDFIANTASRVGDFISSIFYALGDFFQNIVTKTFEFFGNIFKHLGQFLADNFGAVGEFFGTILWNFGDFISNIGEFLGNLIHMVFEKVGDFFLNIGERTSELFSNLKEKALNFFAEHGEDITNFFSNIFGKIGDFFGNIFSKIGEWFGNIRQNIANWFDNLIGWFKSLPSYFFDAGAKMFSGLWDGIKSIWDKITGWVVEKMQWLGDKLFGWIPGFSSGNMFGTLWNNITGSHANGLDYVPYDGYIAELHRGERVLTKAENKEYNSGNGGSGGDTFNFYNTKPDPYEYARQMKRAKREMALT